MAVDALADLSMLSPPRSTSPFYTCCALSCVYRLRTRRLDRGSRWCSQRPELKLDRAHEAGELAVLQAAR